MRAFGERSWYICGRKCAVGVLGLAKANAGANARNKAIEALIFIKGNLSAASIGRAANSAGFRFLAGKRSESSRAYSIREQDHFF